MFDYIQKEKEIIRQLNTELYDLRVFLIGNVNKDEVSETVRESNCLQDDLVANLNALDCGLDTLKHISAVIRGDKK